MKNIILASQSPRRTEILNILGIAHKIEVADIDETPHLGETPVELVKRLAQTKALAVAKSRVNEYVIGSDTIVVQDGRVLGKPNNENDAIAMLRSLSGHKHQVITGVSVVDADTGRFTTKIGITDVQMKVLSDQTINAYVNSGEPMDKAGAYGIQGLGSSLVHSITGEFYTVMGLSVNALLDAFGEFDLSLFGELRAHNC